MKNYIGVCPDCGKEKEIIKSVGICERCRTRKNNAKYRKKEYVPYINLSEEDKKRVDIQQKAQEERRIQEKDDDVKEIPIPKIPVIENYYQVKAENNPAIAHIVEKPENVIIEPIEEDDGTEESKIKSTMQNINPLSNQENFINTLRGYGCEIPEDILKDVLNVLVSTDKLKNIFMIIAKSDSQQAILDLEQALNVVERKLQHDWEYNGFQKEDDIRFKEFLTWRRILKGAIFFWKKLYQTNTIIELERAWNAYTADPNDKILLAGDRIESKKKRFQITTESISTILNTRRPFTRVFYAESKEDAYDQFIKWMSDRQLHEDKTKTTIVELGTEGKDGREKND